MSRVLAIDLGGTSFRAAIASADDDAAIQMIGRWPSPAGLEEFVRRLSELVRDVAPTGVGVTVPGFVEGTVCRWVPNLPFLDGIDLAGLLAAPSPPFVAANDAQLALLAEATHGAARKISDAILLAIGTGIGSAVLVDGRIVRGAHGGACSFGWASADLSDPGDARHGWLERHASGRALDAAATGIGVKDGEAVIAAARAGDSAGLAVIDRLGAAIGTALAGAIALVDPALILVAGGVSSAVDVLAPSIRAATERHLPAHLRSFRLEAGKFGAQAGLVGAAVAAVRGPEWWRVG
jgi:predicted NBD/HSP70 family sugar kinase